MGGPGGRPRGPRRRRHAQPTAGAAPTAATHPVEDFLFRYYNNSPARLRRWHPGAGVLLEDAAGLPRASVDPLPGRRRRGGARRRGLPRGPGPGRDASCASLLSATASRPAAAGLLGLHEWAMVLRHPGRRRAACRLAAAAGQRRHRRGGRAARHPVLALRRVPVLHRVGAPRNACSRSRDSQVAMEQPGCLHAGMDVYKWAFSCSAARGERAGSPLRRSSTSPDVSPVAGMQSYARTGPGWTRAG